MSSGADSQPGAESISVIVVSYACAGTLPECVARVLDSPNLAELLLVDNAPGDGSVSALAASERQHPKLRVIDNPGNPGFAHACNRAAAQAKGDWLLLLNPDCYLPFDATQKLLEAAAGLSHLGLMGALLVNRNGRIEPASLRRDPTPLRAVLGALGGDRLARILDRPDWAIACPPPKVAGLVQVQALSGALMLIRRELYAELGGLDQGYFLHCEDLDLCRRARLAGYTNYVDTRIVVPHWKGTSSAGQPLTVAWHKHRGMLRYYRRFDAEHTPALLRAALVAGAWARVLLLTPWLGFKQALRRGRRVPWVG
ncbi:MAG: glycosyltransferase family 2 protein [Xanthomonadales bacterium]|nr:glycosyltransferase family 2 protein [Xanthomonadales bacterium]